MLTLLVSSGIIPYHLKIRNTVDISVKGNMGQCNSSLSVSSRVMSGLPSQSCNVNTVWPKRKHSVTDSCGILHIRLNIVFHDRWLSEIIPIAKHMLRDIALYQHLLTLFTNTDRDNSIATSFFVK
jgi:hypothetical protein